MHMIHSSLVDIGGAMPGYAECVENATIVLKFMSSRECKDSLVEVCFPSPSTGSLRKDVMGCNAEIYDKCFNSMVDCLLHILPMRGPLQLHFNPATFENLMPKHFSIDVVTAALTSNCWLVHDGASCLLRHPNLVRMFSERLQVPPCKICFPKQYAYLFLCGVQPFTRR